MDILKELNNNLCDNMGSGWFITLTLGLIDLEKMEFTFCRAGHTPVYICCNGELKEFQPSGLGLGLAKGPKFDNNLLQLSIPLESGTGVYLFSDGITEMNDSFNAVYDYHRLKEMIKVNCSETPAKILNLVVDDLNTFRGNTPQRDDSTMLIFKVQ